MPSLAARAARARDLHRSSMHDNTALPPIPAAWRCALDNCQRMHMAMLTISGRRSLSRMTRLSAVCTAALSCRQQNS